MARAYPKQEDTRSISTTPFLIGCYFIVGLLITLPPVVCQRYQFNLHVSEERQCATKFLFYESTRQQSCNRSLSTDLQNNGLAYPLFSILPPPSPPKKKYIKNALSHNAARSESAPDSTHTETEACYRFLRTDFQDNAQATPLFSTLPPPPLLPA